MEWGEMSIFQVGCEWPRIIRTLKQRIKLMRIYEIQNIGKAKLAMMARPRGGEWLTNEVAEIQKAGVQVVVSLLEAAEIQELALQAEKQICESYDLQFYHCPIPDRGTPPSETKFRQLLNELDMLLNEGKFIVVHCRMGIGRTGMLAAALSIRRGVNHNEVFSILSRIRTIEVPDTEGQKRWILDRKWVSG